MFRTKNNNILSSRRRGVRKRYSDTVLFLLFFFFVFFVLLSSVYFGSAMIKTRVVARRPQYFILGWYRDYFKLQMDDSAAAY